MQPCRLNQPYFPLVACLLLLLFSQCVSKEDELVPLPSVEVDMEMDLPQIMAPEIEMEEPPDYEALFGQNLSLGVVEDIQKLGGGGEMPLSTISLLDLLLAHARELDPELQALAGTINIDFLLKVIDHRNPLDPRLEEFLQVMIQKEMKNLFQSLIPPVNPFIGPDKKMKAKENNGQPEQEIFRKNGGDYPCSEYIDNEIRERFRYCGVGVWMFESQLDEVYRPLMADADERYLDRADLIHAIYEQKLLLVATGIKDMVATVNVLNQLGIQPELKKQLGYFGLVYAYAIRVYLQRTYDVAKDLNEAYHEKELALLEEAKEPEMEKIREWARNCDEEVKTSIKRLIDSTCPGYRPPNIYD